VTASTPRLTVSSADAGPIALIDEDREAARFRVHRSVFTSPDVFGLERRAFWQHEWLYLGHGSEVPAPGDFIRRNLAGRELIFCRSTDGELRTFLNACPHRGTTVCRDHRGNSRFFTCFYHAWSFANDGRLVAMPDREAYEGTHFGEGELDLPRVPRMASYRDWVFVSFSSDGKDLQSHLAGAAESLDLIADQSPDGVEVVAGTHVYTSRTNWKLAVENALDGYHFGPTHATFIEARKATGYVVDGQGGWADLGGGHSLFESRGFYGRSGLSWEPSWGDDEHRRIEAVRAELATRLGPERMSRIADWSRNTFIFPNLIVFDFAGISFRVLEPVAPGRTEIRAYEMAPRREPAAARRLRLDNILSFVGPGGFATPDDLEAQQGAQLGYETTSADTRPGVAWSDVSRGMAAELRGEQTDIYDEGHIRAFWRHWQDRVSAAADRMP
jgi:p-cumate 2,3-dioxygenase subunit alpha